MPYTDMNQPWVVSPILNLPPHPIPQGHPRAPRAPCLMHRIWTTLAFDKHVNFEGEGKQSCRTEFVPWNLIIFLDRVSKFSWFVGYLPGVPRIACWNGKPPPSLTLELVSEPIVCVCVCVCVCVSISVVPNSLWPHRLQPARLLCP